MTTFSILILLHFLIIGIWLGRRDRPLDGKTTGGIIIYLLIFHIGAGLWLLFAPPSPPVIPADNEADLSQPHH